MYRHFTQQCFIPLWQVWADIECNVHVALPKWPINKFNPIPTDLYHVIIVYGLIQPMAGRNRVKPKVVPEGWAVIFFITPFL